MGSDKVELAYFISQKRQSSICQSYKVTTKFIYKKWLDIEDVGAESYTFLFSFTAS